MCGTVLVGVSHKGLMAAGIQTFAGSMAAKKTLSYPYLHYSLSWLPLTFVIATLQGNGTIIHSMGDTTRDWTRGHVPIAGFTFVEPWQSFGGGGVSGTDTLNCTAYALHGCKA